MIGEDQIIYTPACLSCGWVGSDGGRAEAETEGAMHERGERQPWQLAPGTPSPWRPADPATRDG
jgi:hypothetical protein